MEANKESQVDMLPTEDKTNIGLLNNRIGYLPELRYNKDWSFVEKNWKPQHLYFTTDEEIKEGDWFIAIDNSINKRKPSWEALSSDRKIVATTDELLKLPKIPQTFSKTFCESGGIWKVLVAYNGTEWFNNNRVWRPYPDSETTIRRNIPKVNSNNEITIHPIKNSWNREEVIGLCKNAYSEGYNAAVTSINNDRYDEDYKIVSNEEWIKQNL